MKFITVNEFAKILRVRPLTIKRWERRGEAQVEPVVINSRGDRRYRISDIEEAYGISIDE